MENKTEKSILREIIDWILLIVIVVLVASIVHSQLFALSEVNMNSMRDTLVPGDKLIMNKLSYAFKEPERGDIIIFLRDEQVNGVLGRVSIYLTDVVKIFNGEYRSNRLIKRVIGVPGDEIEIRDNVLYINGVAQDESYARIDPYENVVLNGDMEKVTVPPGKLFVLGDNRGQSNDSRHFGLIDRSWVEGKAIFRVYPFNKIGAVK